MHILKRIIRLSEWNNYYSEIVRSSLSNREPDDNGNISAYFNRPFKSPCLIAYRLQRVEGLNRLIFMYCDRPSAKRLLYPGTNKFIEPPMRNTMFYPPRPHFENMQIEPVLNHIIERLTIGATRGLSINAGIQQREIRNAQLSISDQNNPVLIGGVRITNPANRMEFYVIFYIVLLQDAKALVYSKRNKAKKVKKLEGSFSEANTMKHITNDTMKIHAAVTPQYANVSRSSHIITTSPVEPQHLRGEVTPAPSVEPRRMKTKTNSYYPYHTRLFEQVTNNDDNF